MQSFDYVSPATKAEAVHLLETNWGATEVVAGGSDLLALMKADVVAPQRLVNIKNIDGLQGVAMTRERLHIGALARLSDLADDQNVQKNYPALAEALLEAASPQIRNVATLGGNLCQRPRCWYFRNGFGLLAKDKSGKELVIAGDNRYHAILGNTGPAKFVSPSTIAPVLIAYGARIRIEGPAGQRELPLEKFYVIPQAETDREHNLRPNEIVTELVIPSPQSIGVGYCEIRQRQAFDWPLAVAAVALKMNDSRVEAARVVMGHVAPVPWVSAEAERELMGQRVDEEAARSAGDAAVSQATPLSRNAYKVQLARVAVQRAVLRAASGGAA